jgi:GABA permease
MTPRDRTSSGRFRILVVANETLEDDALHQLIADHAGDAPTDVLVVAPALDRVGDAAEARLMHALERLESAGIPAYGWTAHPDPVAAMAGALAVFEADDVIISTYPIGPSSWLARDVLRRARERFGLPIAHVVVDRELAAA